MNIPEPAPRFSTQAALIAINEKLNWPYENWMQDWPLEISNKIDLPICIQEYSKLVDDDEKFLLMKGLLYALDELQGEKFEVYSKKIIEFLKSDFGIHEFTIYYWTCYGSEYESGFTITTLMREIWNSQTGDIL